MKCNVGNRERKYRLLAGIAAIPAIFAFRRKSLKYLFGTVAASGLFTGISRYCPANRALHIDHCPGR